MSKRKVAVCHNVRINVGNYQHIDSTFYSEEEIEYESNEERMAKEDDVNEAVVQFLVRSIRALPGRLGKKTEAVREVEESIKKTIPKWLADDPIPNMANKAKQKFDSVTSEQKVLKDAQTDDTIDEEIKEEPPVLEPVPEKEPEKEEVEENSKEETNDEDLFDDEDLFE